MLNNFFRPLCVTVPEVAPELGNLEEAFEKFVHLPLLNLGPVSHLDSVDPDTSR
jgi:hypothetical protein